MCIIIKSFKEYLMQGPSFEDLDLTRDESPGRDIDLTWMFE